MVEEAVKVFISYSWDSNEHKDKVLGLAQALRDDGVDCTIDQFVLSPDNWDRWILDQVDESKFVLIVCSERYYQRYRGKEEVNKGLGVTWESTLIMGKLYYAQGNNRKFYPIFFDSPDEKIIPDGIRTSFYNLSGYDLLNLDKDKTRLITEGDYKNLYRLLTNQPSVVPRKVGSLKKLATVNREVEQQAAEAEKKRQQELEQQTNDPELKYRRKVEDYVNGVPLSQPYKKISKIYETSLKKYRETLGLAIEKAKAIETDVLRSRDKLHQEYKANLQEYQEALAAALEEEAPWNDANLSVLRDLQNNLKISDKDAELLLLYAKLESSLRKREWKAADETTKNLLLKVANIKQDHFSETDFNKIPCEDLHKIDKLWTDNSNGHFGCSAQKDIWQEVKGNLDDFLIQVGWGFYQENGSFIYQNIANFRFDLNAPKGQIPVSVVYYGGTSPGRRAYMDRIRLCFQDVVS